MSFFNSLTNNLRKIFPSTFSIAILLTIVTIILALSLTDPIDLSTSNSSVIQEIKSDPLSNSSTHILQIFGFWYNGLWQSSLLTFAVQMMLILVLGYVLALTKPVIRIMDSVLKYCNSTSNAALIVTFLTLLVSFINWGIGLVFGAIFARKVAEYAVEKNLKLNYPIIGAAGYSGLMVWHGGFSGSSTLKIAEPGHFMALVNRDLPPISFSETVLSPMNVTISIAVLILLPLSMYFLGRKTKCIQIDIPKTKFESLNDHLLPSGAERLDYSRIFAVIISFIILGIAIYKAVLKGNLSVITPNYINFILLGLGIILHGNISKFLDSVKKAISSASGILIQFPLYFGIMGVMKYSGLVEVFSNFFFEISNEFTFPLYTFISAGIINIFVPSGGGQWAVQGPIIVDSALQVGTTISKSVMAMAYGDQITNMLQPFWALPLLGITGLRVKDIIPYTLFLMMIGIVIYVTGLLLF